jgi:hypothetical protein
MAERNDGAPAAIAGAPDGSARGAAAVRLMPFWSNSPAAWYRAAEAQFALRNVTSDIDKYYVILGALSEANVDRVKHIVEQEPDEHSYQNLKDGLLAAHIMSDYEKIDKLVSMEPLNGRKPSDLLVQMERLKPADANQYFAYHFLQRLPREVRVLLTREPVDNMRALAEKADAFLALHQPQSHDAVAAVSTTPDADEEALAAFKGSNRKGKSGRGGKKNNKQRSHSPSDEKKSPLCWLHIRFGDKARRCEQPCAWPSAEN